MNQRKNGKTEYNNITFAFDHQSNANQRLTRLSLTSFLETILHNVLPTTFEKLKYERFRNCLACRVANLYPRSDGTCFNQSLYIFQPMHCNEYLKRYFIM